MADYVQKIKEKLDIVTLEREDFNTLVKDRLDFGFDSIYFRYALIRDELAHYKFLESRSWEHEQMMANQDKMHFYNCLEQLVHAHGEEGK